MAKVEISYDDKRLRKNIRNINVNLRRAVDAVVDRRAALTTTWLRQNARWTDRTGAARSGLFAIPITTANFAEIYMAYSVSYGIWLEVANDRQYAIITPAIRIMGDALMKDLNGLLDHLEKFQK